MVTRGTAAKIIPPQTAVITETSLQLLTPTTSNKVDYGSFYRAFCIRGGFIFVKLSIN